ncbi:lipoyl(octanoyl) transferase LipB [Siculibacillus lacustris]|uniref:Octanoyltransferase n=1 Tax=Siculibacillus lacustris TaxID=1549641 RepID=A0A4Q9VGC0_9HYPH|nr:lipoyl(octanoyl) transferase LipB [Siculibacillus lacustris]TBW34058.1 lipoyl(octanoyl) transferase LipB [Siculibacillus lacustris]
MSRNDVVAPEVRPSRDDLGGAIEFFASPDAPPVEWRIAEGLVDYESAVAAMEARAAAIAEGRAAELVWLVEHPPLYTAGTSARPEDLLEATRFPVHATGRGGEYTYHGPGQRVAYVMLDLGRRRRDVRAFVAALEAWIIATLAAHGVVGERREDRVGVWVRRPDKPELAPGVVAEDKIAAIGIRLRKWVSFHGIALNVEPDLGHYAGIVPCGIRGHGVTSLVDLGLPVTMTDVDVVLRQCFEETFGPTVGIADSGSGVAG